jgi:hypothetical protein
MGCPMYQEDIDAQPLELIYNPETRYFGVTQGDFIVMESKEPKDVAKYIQDYIESFQNWVANNEDDNAAE